MRETFTFDDMRRVLVVGWGDVGGRAADCWREFNERHFEGVLRPLPIFFTPAAPYGGCVGWTCCQAEVTHIALLRPKDGRFLVADRCTLLHEMIHQYLHQVGENPKHVGAGWRREIMRLHPAITGKKLWAGQPTVTKTASANGTRRSVRVNKPEPVTGEPSIGQADIGRWPHSVGIDLGKL